ALSGLAVQYPRPRLVWTDSSDETIRIATGMERPAFLDLIRNMERDPEHGRHVLHVSRKRRGVEVDTFVAFLTARYAGKPVPAPAGATPADDADALQAELERDLGIEDVPAPAKSRPRRTGKKGATR